MIDTLADGTAVTPSSIFQRVSAAVSGPDPADLDRLAASLDHLMSYHYEPSANQAAQHPLCEA